MACHLPCILLVCQENVIIDHHKRRLPVATNVCGTLSTKCSLGERTSMKQLTQRRVKTVKRLLRLLRQTVEINPVQERIALATDVGTQKVHRVCHVGRIWHVNGNFPDKPSQVLIQRLTKCC